MKNGTHITTAKSLFTCAIVLALALALASCYYSGSRGGDQTGVSGDQSADEGDHTGVGGDQSSDGGDHTGVGGDQSADEGDHTGVGGDQSSDGGDHTGVGGDQSADGGDQSSDGSSGSSNFGILSTSYEDGEFIHMRHACASYLSLVGAANISPQYAWSNPPSGTSSYALIMDDEVDPPCGEKDGACRHWAVFNIPSSVTSLDESADISKIQGAVEGRNYIYSPQIPPEFLEVAIGYVGPCPDGSNIPDRIYKTTVYALGQDMPAIAAEQAYTRSQFQSQFAQHILGSATISAKFSSLVARTH